MAHQGLLGHHVEADPPDARRRPGEVAVDQLGSEPHGLEDLGAGVGVDGGDAHLRDDLAHPLVERVDVALLGPGEVGPGGQQPAPLQLADRLHGEVRVHRLGAESHQEGDVHDLAGLARLDDHPHAAAGVLPDQVVVDRGGGE